LKGSLADAYADRLEQEVRALKSQAQPSKITPVYQQTFIDKGIKVQHIVVSSPSELLTPPGQQEGSFHISSPRSQSDRGLRVPELDFNSLPLTSLFELCNAWFERYHSWFPILHKLSILGKLQDDAPLSESPFFIVIKAIVAVTIPHLCSSNPLSQEERKRLSEQIREQVILQSISNLSLQSLQAVLIVTNIDYGAGKLSEFWNLVALCKR
jgi:hypothetical protein